MNFPANAGVLLVAHGTVETSMIWGIRGAHSPRSPGAARLVEELRRRYEAIGGSSPLLQTTREQASALAKRSSTRAGGDAALEPGVEQALAAPRRSVCRAWS